MWVTTLVLTAIKVKWPVGSRLITPTLCCQLATRVYLGTLITFVLNLKTVGLFLIKTKRVITLKLARQVKQAGVMKFLTYLLINLYSKYWLILVRGAYRHTQWLGILEAKKREANVGIAFMKTRIYQARLLIGWGNLTIGMPVAQNVIPRI